MAWSERRSSIPCPSRLGWASSDIVASKARDGSSSVRRGASAAASPGSSSSIQAGNHSGGHLGLEILLQSDAPCGPECPIRKVRRFDYPLEHLWGKVAQSEPRLDGVGTVVQPPMGFGKLREQSRFGRVARYSEHRLSQVLPVQPLVVCPGGMALGTARVERGWVERPGDVAPQRRQEIAPPGAEQNGGGGDPLALHPFEQFKPLRGSLQSRLLQRRDQFQGMEPLSMVAINPDQPLERLARLTGITCDQRIEQCVDRGGLCTVDEEVELVVLPGVARPGAQQRIQPGIGRRDQNGSGVVLPAMMHRRLGGQTERAGPRLRPLEPNADLALRIRENRIQGLESTFTPCPIVLVAETVCRQQQLQRRVLAMLHHELLNGGLDLCGVGVHRCDVA